MNVENIERIDFYFDTSAINNLYKYLIEIKKDPLEWAKKFRHKYSILISAINIAEICATSVPELRENLLRFCYELLQGEKGEDKYLPADFPFELLKRALISYLYRKNKKEFRVNINLEENKGLWITLLDPTQVDEEARKECWKYCEDQKNWYETMHLEGREALQSEIQSTDEYESEEKFMQYANSFSAQQALLGRIISEILKELSKAIEVIGEEALIKGLLQGVCIWRSFYYTLMYEIYHRGIKRQNYGKHKNPGSLDIQQAVYLCFAKTFVTHDQALLNHLKSIIKHSGIDTEVWDFQYFIDRISIT